MRDHVHDRDALTSPVSVILIDRDNERSSENVVERESDLVVLAENESVRVWEVDGVVDTETDRDTSRDGDFVQDLERVEVSEMLRVRLKVLCSVGDPTTVLEGVAVGRGGVVIRLVPDKVISSEPDSVVERVTERESVVDGETDELLLRENSGDALQVREGERSQVNDDECDGVGGGVMVAVVLDDVAADCVRLGDRGPVGLVDTEGDMVLRVGVSTGVAVTTFETVG